MGKLQVPVVSGCMGGIAFDAACQVMIARDMPEGIEYWTNFERDIKNGK